MLTEEIRQLSDIEKLELISEIWESMENPETLPVPEKYKEILIKRIKDILNEKYKLYNKDEIEKLLDFIVS